MRDLGEERAHRDDHASVDRSGHGDHVVAEGAPTQLRFDAGEQHDVDFCVGDGAGVERGARPLDLSSAAEVDAHLGSGRGEVEELLGIEVDELVGVPRIDEVVDRGARGIAGIVPTAERDQHHRRAQLGTIGPTQMGVRVAGRCGHRRRLPVSWMMRGGHGVWTACGSEADRNHSGHAMGWVVMMRGDCRSSRSSALDSSNRLRIEAMVGELGSAERR